MGSVRVAGVTKTFGDTTALDDLSFDVDDGEFFCILGPSGAGKTTTLRTIAGLIASDRGEVFIGDRSMADVHPRDRNIGFFFQEVALYPHLTGFDNIAFPLRERKASKSDVIGDVHSIAELLHIGHLLGRKPATYSGGERQRVALARALVRRAGLYLLDEPLSNLDAKLRVEAREELKRLQREFGQTTIYVTPDQAEAMAMGDRLLVLNRGVAQQSGMPAEVYDRPLNRFVATFIGSPPMNLLRCELSEEADGWWVRHPAFSVRVDGAAGVPGAGGEVLLGIRPEDVAMSNGTGRTCEATVYISEQLGHRTLVDFELGGDTVRALVPGFNHFEIGERHGLTFDLGRAHVLDQATETLVLRGDVLAPVHSNRGGRT